MQQGMLSGLRAAALCWLLCNVITVCGDSIETSLAPRHAPADRRGQNEVLNIRRQGIIPIFGPFSLISNILGTIFLTLINLLTAAFDVGGFISQSIRGSIAVATFVFRSFGGPIGLPFLITALVHSAVSVRILSLLCLSSSASGTDLCPVNWIVERISHAGANNIVIEE